MFLPWRSLPFKVLSLLCYQYAMKWCKNGTFFVEKLSERCSSKVWLEEITWILPKLCRIMGATRSKKLLTSDYCQTITANKLSKIFTQFWFHLILAHNIVYYDNSFNNKMIWIKGGVKLEFDQKLVWFENLRSYWFERVKIFEKFDEN